MGRAGRTSLATTARDRAKAGKGQLLQVLDLGKAPFQKSAVFFNHSPDQEKLAHPF